MKIKHLWLWQSIAHMKKMHSETIYSNLEFSGVKCASFLIDHVNSDQFIQINEKSLMLGEVSEVFFGNDSAANDILMYVRPEFRCNGLAEAAVECFFSWAESRNAKLITMGQSTAGNIAEFKSLTNKLNLQPLGSVCGRLLCVKK